MWIYTEGNQCAENECILQSEPEQRAKKKKKKKNRRKVVFNPRFSRAKTTFFFTHVYLYLSIYIYIYTHTYRVSVSQTRSGVKTFNFEGFSR